MEEKSFAQSVARLQTLLSRGREASTVEELTKIIREAEPKEHEREFVAVMTVVLDNNIYKAGASCPIALRFWLGPPSALAEALDTKHRITLINGKFYVTDGAAVGKGYFETAQDMPPRSHGNSRFDPSRENSFRGKRGRGGRRDPSDAPRLAAEKPRNTVEQPKKQVKNKEKYNKNKPPKLSQKIEPLSPEETVELLQPNEQGKSGVE